MKTETKEILGFNVPIVGICETIAELVEAAGSEAAIVNDANNSTLAHSHYAIVRRAIVKVLVQETGIKQLTEKDAKSGKDVVIETEGEYLARLETELGENFRDTHAASIKEVVGKLTVDYKPGTRGSGEGSKPAKKWYAYVEEMKAQNKLDLYLSKFGISTDGKTSEEIDTELALAVKKKITDAEKAAAQAALA